MKKLLFILSISFLISCNNNIKKHNEEISTYIVFNIQNLNDKTSLYTIKPIRENIDFLGEIEFVHIDSINKFKLNDTLTLTLKTWKN